MSHPDKRRARRRDVDGEAPCTAPQRTRRDAPRQRNVAVRLRADVARRQSWRLIGAATRRCFDHHPHGSDPFDAARRDDFERFARDHATRQPVLENERVVDVTVAREHGLRQIREGNVCEQTHFPVVGDGVRGARQQRTRTDMRVAAAKSRDSHCVFIFCLQGRAKIVNIDSPTITAMARA